MDSGVVLTTSSRGVYAKRLCQGRVFWRGPHTLTDTATKMERGVKPTLIFNRQFFKQGNFKQEVELMSLEQTEILPGLIGALHCGVKGV